MKRKETLRKMSHKKLAKIARTHIKCSICNNFYDGNDDYGWYTKDWKPVCYICANEEI